MVTNAVIIATPHIDFDEFIAAANTVLGRNPADKVDGSPVQRSTAERFTTCLGSMNNPESPSGLHEEYLSHLSYSVFLVCPTWDLMSILAVSSGMPFVATETRDARHCAVVLTGTLKQWRAAVRNGTALRQPDGCREMYCRIMERFESIGLGKLWRHLDKQWDSENLFYLKHDRN